MSNDRNSELTAVRNGLREIGEFAEQASLTGSPKTGAPRLAEHYNALLARVRELATVPEGLFVPIQAADGDYGQICVDSRMLLAHVSDRQRKHGRDDDEFGPIVALAPFVDSGDLGRLIREKMNSGIQIPEGLLPALAPFLESAMLSEIVRDRLDAQTRPVPHAASPQPPVARPPEPGPGLVRSEEPQDELQALASRLSQPDLSDEERKSIGMRLANIAHQVATAPDFGNAPPS